MSSKSGSRYSQLSRSRTRSRTPKSSSRMQSVSQKSGNRMQSQSPKSSRRSRSPNPRSGRRTRSRSPKSRSKSPKSALSTSRTTNPGNPSLGNKGQPAPFNIWKRHDSYGPGTSPTRIVTRSQTGFNRVKKTDSNTILFGNEKKFVVHNCPHLSVIMKGRHGALPATIITRSSGKYYTKDDKLEGKLKWYKSGKGRDAPKPGEEGFEEFSLNMDDDDDEYMCSIQ